MEIIYTEQDADFLALSAQLKLVANWLEEHSGDVDSYPCSRWLERLRWHRDLWDGHLKERNLLPKQPNVDREAAARVVDGIKSVLGTGDGTGALLAGLQERLETLRDEAQKARGHLAREPGDPRADAVDAIIGDADEMLRCLSDAADRSPP